MRQQHEISTSLHATTTTAAAVCSMQYLITLVDGVTAMYATIYNLH